MSGPDRRTTELYVQTLGGFHVFMDGEELDFGNNPTANAVKLIAIIFLNAETGISRKQLVEEVFGTKLLSDRNNSFNNLLYQARHLMQHAGIRGNRLIENHRGQVNLEQGIHVSLDRDRFAACTEAGLACSDEEEKYRLMREAFALCKGEFLPEFMTEDWVLRENASLRRRFDACVRFLGNYEKTHGNYDAMYEIYKTCVDLYQDSSWRSSMIEALALRGDCEEAYREYYDAVRYYADILEIPVPENLIDIYDGIAAVCQWESEEERRRQNSLLRQDRERRQLLSEGKAGACFCPFSSFGDVYEALRRNMETRNNQVHIMLCRVTGEECDENTVIRTKHSETLKQALRETLPREFVCTRYSTKDFLVILTGTDRAGCMKYYRRILQRFVELAGPECELICRLMDRTEFAGIQGQNNTNRGTDL
ncbi:MAG TPA: hypothetical protein DCG70_06610 [Lachnoclostridium sp.]|nr:hypothetical protein [Lachnoclostridium sp.]